MKEFGSEKITFRQNDSYENVDNFSLIRLLYMHRWCLHGPINSYHSFWWSKLILCIYNIQSNLGYPNADYPKLLGYSKTTDSPDFFLYNLLQLNYLIIQISIIRKIQFFEVIRRSWSKKLLLNYPSRFQVQMSCMVIMISLFGWVRFTHPSDFANKVATVNWHRINVHTITWCTVKLVNGVLNLGRLQ